MSDFDDDLIGVPEQDWTIEDRLNDFKSIPPNMQAIWMRALIKANPVLAMEAMSPDSDSVERFDILSEYRHLKARHIAKEKFDRWLNPTSDQPKPPLVSLTDFLAEPDEDVAYRIDGLWPREGRIVLAAQNKSGKTTLVGNLIRSLVDGDDFLGQFAVECAQRVVLLDNEMSPRQSRRWLRDQGALKTDSVDVVSMRGRISSFNILDPTVRAEWAELIGEADVLIVDCLRPALDALGLSEDKESGRFLEALDELIHAAGIPELVLVHHMGHSNERSRGDSRLEDWPDAKWKLVRQADPNDHDAAQAADRYFSAFGRDVDQSEVRLAFDSETRHLTVSGGSRRAATSSRIENGVQVFVAANPGCSQEQIRAAVEGDNNGITKAIRGLNADGWLRIEKQGQGKANLHFSSQPTSDFSEPG